MPLFERWHQVTSSFHLPVEEMTITLDDVSCLLHLVVIGKPIDHVPLLFDKEAMEILLMTHLGISRETKVATVTNVGAKVRLTWLEDLYHRYVESGLYVWTVTTYLLHLIDSIIFADKSLTHVYVAYLCVTPLK